MCRENDVEPNRTKEKKGRTTTNAKNKVEKSGRRNQMAALKSFGKLINSCLRKNHCTKNINFIVAEMFCGVICYVLFRVGLFCHCIFVSFCSSFVRLFFHCWLPCLLSAIKYLVNNKLIYSETMHRHLFSFQPFFHWFVFSTPFFA